MKPIYTAISLVILTMSCINKYKDKENSIEASENNTVIKTEEIKDYDVYDDIDLFKLDGINKIHKPVRYPYIIIEDKSKLEKRVVYKISYSDSVETVYKLYNGYWTSLHEWETDTGYAITYQYIKPDKIIELDYQGTWEKKDYHLHRASLYEKGIEIAYSYFGDKGIIINPKPENFQVVRKKANSIYRTSYEKKDSLLKVISNYTDIKENRIFFSDTSCYKTDGHSDFWWKYFGRQKINCN
jgi:hypothetical protein